jgi:hypothetical protein
MGALVQLVNFTKYSKIQLIDTLFIFLVYRDCHTAAILFWFTWFLYWWSGTIEMPCCLKIAPNWWLFLRTPRKRRWSIARDGNWDLIFIGSSFLNYNRLIFYLGWYITWLIIRVQQIDPFFMQIHPRL